jgi:hypothetical protein
MKKRTKLVLEKETLVALDRAPLGRVHGGVELAVHDLGPEDVRRKCVDRIAAEPISGGELVCAAWTELVELLGN